MKLLGKLAFATVATLAAASSAQALCAVNLAVYTTYVNEGAHNRIITTVHNNGLWNFISAPNQQQLVMTVQGSQMHYHPLVGLAAGASIGWEQLVPVDDYVNRIAVELVFQPSVATDGNLWNDDCERSDNIARLRLN